MTNSTPGVAQVFERDRKFERFQGALETIASRKPDLNAMASDQAPAALREVIGLARGALEQ